MVLDRRRPRARGRRRRAPPAPRAPGAARGRAPPPARRPRSRRVGSRARSSSPRRCQRRARRRAAPPAGRRARAAPASARASFSPSPKLGGSWSPRSHSADERRLVVRILVQRLLEQRGRLLRPRPLGQQEGGVAPALGALLGILDQVDEQRRGVAPPPRESPLARCSLSVFSSSATCSSRRRRRGLVRLVVGLERLRLVVELDVADRRAAPASARAPRGRTTRRPGAAGSWPPSRCSPRSSARSASARSEAPVPAAQRQRRLVELDRALRAGAA